MNKTHTPGPWRCQHIKTEGSKNNLIHTFEVYTSPDGEHDNEIGMLTAKLIQASPQLIKALELANEIIERLCSDYSAIAGKHANFTNGESKIIESAINNAK